MGKTGVIIRRLVINYNYESIIPFSKFVTQPAVFDGLFLIQGSLYDTNPNNALQ